MELGISSFTYGWNVGVEGYLPENPMTEVDLIQQTVDFGLRCLQVGDNLPLHLFNDDRKKAFRDLLLNNQIRLEIGAKRLEADHLHCYLQLAVFFDAPLLRFVVDDGAYEPAPATIIAIIKEFLPFLTAHKITLGLENHDRFKVKELAAIVEKVGHEQVGICLDCANSIGAGEGLAQVAEVLAPYTVNLHLKDFSIRRLPYKMGFIVAGETMGKGMIDLPWLLDKVNAAGRCQSAILEQWVPPEADIADTCKKEKNWAAEGVQFLQEFRLVNGNIHH